MKKQSTRKTRTAAVTEDLGLVRASLRMVERNLQLMELASDIYVGKLDPELPRLAAGGKDGSDGGYHLWYLSSRSAFSVESYSLNDQGGVTERHKRLLGSHHAWQRQALTLLPEFLMRTVADWEMRPATERLIAHE
jgi:hypothetical protein